jgi:hypothetical protein
MSLWGSEESVTMKHEREDDDRLLRGGDDLTPARGMEEDGTRKSVIECVGNKRVGHQRRSR